MNVAKYIDCTKVLLPKYKEAENTFQVGLQFLSMRIHECLTKGSPGNDCLQEGMKTGDDLVNLIYRDIR